MRKLRLKMFCEVGKPIVGEEPRPDPGTLDSLFLTDPCGLRGAGMALGSYHPVSTPSPRLGPTRTLTFWYLCVINSHLGMIVQR